ncbi:MAG: thioredoxin-disulfide reductase [Verrucomicrobia bacterium GWC2_42_7]|nr:MAG: thioredoxin-disulfide reductase [Verrucomicrobia bacterium GWC2_42_7]
MENVIIIGTGCAGLTAGIYAARANLNPVLIEGLLPGGQLTTTSEVENFPGFPEGIDGFDLTVRMRAQAERFGARFISDDIKSVSFSEGNNKLFGETTTYESKTIIVATGASPRLTNVPGEKEMFGGKGVTTCATCDGAFYRNMDVVVIGGGDSACEEALFLTQFASKIFLVHRRDTLRASQIMRQRVLEHKKITPLWNSVLEAILPDENGKVRGVSLKNTVTNQTVEQPCKGVFLAIGHTPNTAIFANALKLDEAGYVITEEDSMVKTAINGVFAAGDCVDYTYRQAITAAGTGCQAAMEVERWLLSM